MLQFFNNKFSIYTLYFATLQKEKVPQSFCRLLFLFYYDIIILWI